MMVLPYTLHISYTARLKFFVNQPRAVSETDDIELEELMARVEKENLEVSGDEDTDAEVEDE